MTQEQIAKIQRVKVALLEVRPQTTEEWERGFQRDTHPDREIERWLRIAHAYQRFIRAHPELGKPGREEAFQSLLYRTMVPATLFARARPALAPSLTDAELAELLQLL